MYQIGIDFGDSTISASAYVDGQPEAIKMVDRTTRSENPYVFPVSAFLNEKHEILFGYEAESRRIQSPLCYRNGFKKDIGSPVPYHISGIDVSPLELCINLLRHVYRRAVRTYGSDIGKTVITYSPGTPSYKTDLLRKAAIMAGFANIELVDDAFAAATYACYTNRYPFGSVFLIIDIGSTHFYMTLKLYEQAGFRDVVPPVRVDYCGGFDIQRRLVDWITEKNADSIERLQKSGCHSFICTVEEMAQTAMLSLDTQDSVVLEEQIESELIQCRINCSEYEKILSGYVATMVKMVNQTLKKTGFGPADIRDVVFVGGMTKTPYIRRHICEILERKPKNSSSDMPESTVSMGAVLHAVGALNGRAVVADAERLPLKIGSYLSFGTYNDQGIIWQIINRDDSSYHAISDRVLTFKAYDAFGQDGEQHKYTLEESYGSGTWKNSSLREWLNSDAKKVAFSHLPPNGDRVWYNSYDDEPGFLNAFDFKQKKALISCLRILTDKCPNGSVSDLSTLFENCKNLSTREYNDMVALPTPELLSEYLTVRQAMPTAEAAGRCEGTFGEDYSDDKTCAYWILTASSSQPEFSGILTENGLADKRVACDGTVGVRPVIAIHRMVYAISGDGSKSNPFKIII